MRYWWVNQNQTFEHEILGKYLWSPKRNRDGGLNPFYETMREVARGDLVFSFNNRKIMALGVAIQPAETSPKPVAFGNTGAYWNDIGWRVDVDFVRLTQQVEPRRHMDVLASLLPPKYSPIRADGTGNQVYLAEIPAVLATVLINLIGFEATAIISTEQEVQNVHEPSQENFFQESDLMKKWEEHELAELNEDETLTETEKAQVIKSRRGQGLFRQRVATIERHCRITRVDNPSHLIASHIKPWKVAENEERLDGENGFFLTPNADHLFGRGFISFGNDGGLIVSPTAHEESLDRMGVATSSPLNVGVFTKKQQSYLEYHRDCILLLAKK